MKIVKTTETLESKKRSRAESIENAKDKPEDAFEPGMKTEEMPAPAYGSQGYWEKRYENKTHEQAQTNEDDPDPYHAWYFKFVDLAPILLPLILGSACHDDEDDTDDENNGNSDQNTEDKIGDAKPEKKPHHNEVDSSSQILSQAIESPRSNDDQTKRPVQQNNNKLEIVDLEQKIKNQDVEQIDAGIKNDDEDSSGEASDEEIEGFELAETDDEDDDANSVTVRVGLAKNSPISVLEVGCGDAPLGQDLAFSIQEYGRKNGLDPSRIIKTILCLDYSKNVINTMKQEQQQQQLQCKKKGIPVLYEEGDARNLSYENESFEVILEKGTLDAMLSDSDGQTNCRKIVSECARLLTIGGYIVIISHLNAHVDSGLEWLNNVIIPGLRAAGNFEWLIEVHGSDVEIPSDVDSETEGGNDKEIESPGPAVYFIEKVGILTQAEANTDNEQLLSSIPIKFFSY